ncbi:MAG: hypothetical protein CL798_06990, partial [Chromatiales bacterium]|nr:hypothetical protein [Chromatiales bacterium]
MKTFLRIIGALFLLLILGLGGLALTLEASLPTSTIDLQPMSPTPITSEATSILIFGATRNTGLMVA